MATGPIVRTGYQGATVVTPNPRVVTHQGVANSQVMSPNAAPTYHREDRNTSLYVLQYANGAWPIRPANVGTPILWIATSSVSNPTGASTGDIVVMSGGVIKVYNGSSWV